MARIGVIITVGVWIAIGGFVGVFFHSMSARKEEERRLLAAVANLMDEEQHAQILVDSIETGESGEMVTRLRWVEVDPEGRPFAPGKPRTIEVKGNDVYIDAWQVVFDPASIKEGDPLRGKSLTLFSRIYGADQAPNEGVRLHVPAQTPGPDETAGLIPPAFRQSKGEAGELEKRLWQQFFALCVDADAAKKAGVRTVQGTAVHKPLVEGKLYRISVDRKGQITFGNPEDPPPFTGP